MLRLLRTVTEGPVKFAEFSDTDSDIRISVATDAMGTQICRRGCFFPDARDFGSLEAGIKYLLTHEEEAIRFFKTAKTTPGNNFATMVMGIMAHQERQ